MATTRLAYLQEMGTARIFSELPIARYRTPSVLPNGADDQIDPHNNIGRFCDISPRIAQFYDWVDDTEPRGWQIVGRNSEGRYLVVHRNDKAFISASVTLSDLGNLY